MYVVQNLKNNLLGFPAIKALNLLSHVKSIDKTIVSKYPSLFSGLGTFAHEYKIQLKPDAQPLLYVLPGMFHLLLDQKFRQS